MPVAIATAAHALSEFLSDSLCLSADEAVSFLTRAIIVAEVYCGVFLVLSA
jgi:hypothetical protein